ncbi:MAG TPA: Ig-like domain-containing protein [Pyrinomonadaceae bacterium]|nr:Ig-like domain-containing protein [Pyrinomonadaceae bacterium]
MTHRFRSFLTVALLALVVTMFTPSARMQQSATTPAPTAPTLEISPAKPDVAVGQKLQFSVVAKDAAGNAAAAPMPSTWFAAPFDLAGIDATGNAAFYSPGEVLVGAIVNGKAVYLKLTIKPGPVTRVDIEPVKTALIVGATTKLSGVARSSEGNPRNDAAIAWTSSNPEVATVDPAGLVVGVSPGDAKITAASGSGSGSTNLTVIKSSLTGLSIEPRTATARTGEVLRFNVSAKVGKADNYAVRWTANGPAATIDADGGFVAELPGSYVITAASGDQEAIASVVVTPRNAERSIAVVGRMVNKEFATAEEWIFGNYAYVSTIADRFLVFDISDPAKPKQTDSVKVDARIINDISTTADGKILVISREGASNRKNGIAFYDNSDPAHPKPISEYTETVTGGVHSAFVDSHYVYLTDDTTGSMRVIDFADVKNPKEVARWEVPNEVATTVKTTEGNQVGGRYLHDLQVKDGLAYLAYWRDGLVILDVGKGIKGGSPERPQLVSQLRFNHHELYGNGWLAGTHSVFRYKNYVFVGDEVFPPIFDIHSPARIPVRGIVHVIDVSDINAPRKVAEYPVPEAGAHNMWVEDDIMYMGYYTGGGRVVDVSGELRGDLYRQGREIGRLWGGDPAGYKANLPFTWGAQPHKGLIYFNDVNSGIWIVKLGEPNQKGSTTKPGE